MISSRKHYLTELLRVIVSEWGHNQVQDALKRLEDLNTQADPSSGKKSKLSLSRNRSGRAKTQTAIEQVSKVEDLGEKRESLVALAHKFDRKMFLPTVGDVKEFLALMGEHPKPVKDRSDSFRLLLAPLAQLPAERLERLANGNSYSGPSQLGPISDAIKSAGAEMRRSDKVSDTTS